ncbi:unnamed protein product, partial [Ectocarpus fasciculatus]
RCQGWRERSARKTKRPYDRVACLKTAPRDCGLPSKPSRLASRKAGKKKPLPSRYGTVRYGIVSSQTASRSHQGHFFFCLLAVPFFQCFGTTLACVVVFFLPV